MATDTLQAGRAPANAPHDSLAQREGESSQQHGDRLLEAARRGVEMKRADKDPLAAPREIADDLYNKFGRGGARMLRDALECRLNVHEPTRPRDAVTFDGTVYLKVQRSLEDASYRFSQILAVIEAVDGQLDEVRRQTQMFPTLGTLNVIRYIDSATSLNQVTRQLTAKMERRIDRAHDRVWRSEHPEADKAAGEAA